MTIEHYLIIVFGQTFLSAIVAALALVRYQSRELSIRLIGFIFLFGCLTNIAAWLLVKTDTFRQFTNVPGIIHVVIAFCLYSLIYFTALHKKASGAVSIAVAFTMLALINLFFVQKLERNSYTYLLHSAILIVYSLLYFYRLMKDLPSLYLHRIPMFWFNAGVLIFHSGTFFLVAFTSYLVNVMKDNLLIYWSFHNVFSIIEHFIFLIGLYYDLRIRKLRKENPAPLSYH
jgi:hypothetical protein